MATGYSRSILGASDSFKGSFTEGSDVAFDFAWDPCENRNSKLIEAEFYCSVCHEFYCQTCNDVHSSFKANKSHQIYGRDRIDQWGQQSGGDILPIEMCLDHQGGILKMICLNHVTLCCSDCVALDHRACSDVEYIPKIAKGLQQSKDMSIIGKTIDKFIRLIEHQIKSDKKEQTALDKSKQEYAKTVKDIRRQLNDFFDDLEKNAYTESDKFVNATRKDLQQHRKHLEDSKNKLTQLQKAIQPTSTNNESQSFIQMFIAQQQLTKCKDSLQQLLLTSKTGCFHLSMNPKLHELLSISQNHSLGTIKVDAKATKVKIPNITPLPLLQTSQLSSPITPSPSTSTSTAVPTTTVPVSKDPQLQQKQQQLQQSKLYKTENGRDIKIKMPSDKTDCDIRGSCQMPDGYILLTDYKNKKVKRLNSNYEPIDYLDVTQSPIAICSVSDDKAMTTAGNCTIYSLSITKSKLSVTRSLSMQHDCYGIAYHNGRLIVSDRLSKVYIYETSGVCFKILQTHNGRNMFFHTCHIAGSPCGSSIYVTDRRKGIITLDSDGNHVSTYHSDALIHSHGLCVDSQGRILVCGLDSNNVLQLEEGGTKIVGEVVSNSDGIPCPQSICINSHSSSLIVTMLYPFGNCNYIRVFDLK